MPDKGLKITKLYFCRKIKIMSCRKIFSLEPSVNSILIALELEDQVISLPKNENTERRVTKFIYDQLIGNRRSQSIKDSTKIKEQLLQLNPDIIIAPAIEAGNGSNDTVSEILKEWLGQEVQVLFIKTETTAGIIDAISDISASLGIEEKGRLLQEDLEERIALIRHKLKFIEDKPTAALIEQLSPLTFNSNKMNTDLIVQAGGKPAVSGSEIESLKVADPDIIILAPEDYSISKTLQEISFFYELEGWTNLKAVKNDKVFIVDFAADPDKRTIADAAEILAEIFYPAQFAFGREGEVWTKFNFLV